jgi:signal transduction histidine kinase/CheY-like chemotaxis protein/HPt (histidine-containing phosphotransfer) domain-containing protein
MSAATPERSEIRASDAALRADIEDALRPYAKLLTLPPALETRYENRTWRSRGKSLRIWLTMLAAIDVLCIGVDAVTMPAHLPASILVRGVLITSCYVGAAALLLRQRPAWVCGLAVLVPTFVMLVGVGYLGALAGGVHQERYLTAAMFTAFATTVVPNVRFRWAAAQSVLSVLTLCVLLFGHGARSLADIAIDNIELVTFYPVSILAALDVRRWIERMHRRNFLMALRDELRVQDLELSTTRRDSALANMSQGIVMIEKDGLVPVINRRAVELLGLPEWMLQKPIYGRDILSYQRQSGEFDDPAFPTNVATLIGGGDSIGIPPVYERQRPNGTILEVRSTAAPDGRTVRTYTDITERKRNEIALAKARDTAEAASRARSEFLAMMSHEIRTPMNAVLGLTESLLESKLTDEQRKSAQAIQEASDGLLNILNDILDLSKLDAGKLEFEQLPFSLEAVIDNTKSIVGLRAAEKGLALRVEIDPDLPKALIGDPNRLRQIVLNLVSNAVKFTHAGEIVISARCVARDAAHATLLVAVRDTGIGIPPDRVGRLFTDFVQADASIHRQYGGTGLGLAICKRLVDQMGGVISVESIPGRGTRFSFQVALTLADIADLEQRGTPDTTIGLSELLVRLGRPLRILVAEDNATNQLVVTQMLREFAVDLRIANDGAEAVAVATHGDFDAVFMDLRMPRMDGLEAARAIRALAGPRGAVPIVALTANAFADDIKACREAGMNDFVAKPIRKQILIATLAKIAAQALTPARHGAAAFAAATTPSAPVSTPAAPASAPLAAASAPAAPASVPAPPALAPADVLVDRSMLKELCDEIGEEGTRAILDVFLKETCDRLALLETLSAGADRGPIEVEAHTLKGAAGAVGFARVSERAKALEVAARAGAPNDYAAQVAAIRAAFDESCREIEAQPLTDAARAA